MLPATARATKAAGYCHQQQHQQKQRNASTNSSNNKKQLAAAISSNNRSSVMPLGSSKNKVEQHDANNNNRITEQQQNNWGHQCHPQQHASQYGHGSSWVILLAPSKNEGSVLARFGHNAQFTMGQTMLLKLPLAWIKKQEPILHRLIVVSFFCAGLRQLLAGCLLANTATPCDITPLPPRGIAATAAMPIRCRLSVSSFFLLQRQRPVDCFLLFLKVWKVAHKNWMDTGYATCGTCHITMHHSSTATATNNAGWMFSFPLDVASKSHHNTKTNKGHERFSRPLPSPTHHSSGIMRGTKKTQPPHTGTNAAGWLLLLFEKCGIEGDAAGS